MSIVAVETLADSQLVDFLETWEKDYQKAVNNIPLFNPVLTKSWTSRQKIYFAKTFYHVRGHFHNFLWYLGNHAPNLKTKEIILHNIAEEFGGRGKSHEQLYYIFADEIGADLRREMTNEQCYLPFIKKFNHGHIEWLEDNDWEFCMAAFAAYERLDNMDYSNLLKLVKILNISKFGQKFFIAHNNAKHFDRLYDELKNIWSQSSNKVEIAFSFIFEHQIKMWRSLSDAIYRNV